MSAIITEPWAEELIDELNEITKHNVLQLLSIILKMGMDEGTKQEWIATIKDQITDTYTELNSDALSIQNKLCDSIEELLVKSSELCKLLQIEMPQYGSENLSLFEEREMLRRKVDELETIVSTREQELHNLLKRQLAACKNLGRTPKSISKSPLPHAKELDELNDYIKDLELVVFEREDRFLQLKLEVKEIASELGVKPTLAIEKTILSEEDLDFQVTDYNMNWIEEYSTSLKKQREDIKVEIDRLRESVDSLWEMLSEDLKTRNEFSQTHVGVSFNTLKAWKNECKRCEDLKKANIEKFVLELRKGLLGLWEKCHFTNSQRNEFEYFHCTLFTEDLLTFHDMEITKLQKYYEENKELFNLLEKWQQAMNKMVDLEERANAPSRFKNRGGTLLKEEKERNLLRKRIPEYEARLLELGQNFQARTGKCFLSWGEVLEDLINKAHESYKSQKETKLSVRKQQREQQAVTPGKSTTGLCSIMSGSRSNLNTMRTPQLSIAKRKMIPSGSSVIPGKLNLPTPQMSGKKRPPLTELFSKRKKDPRTECPLSLPKIRLNDQTLKRRSRTSLERKRQLRKMKTIAKTAQKKSAADVTEYDIFKTEITAKGACRSTLFNTPL